MTTQLEQAARLALEALVSKDEWGSSIRDAKKKAITALRDALEQPAQDEPVAYYDPQERGFYWAKPTRFDVPMTAKIEPLALYAVAPTPRKPLTDEQINSLRQQYGITSDGRGIKEWTQVVEFARAIEAAHGIGEKN